MSRTLVRQLLTIVVLTFVLGAVENWFISATHLGYWLILAFLIAASLVLPVDLAHAGLHRADPSLYWSLATPPLLFLAMGLAAVALDATWGVLWTLTVAAGTWTLVFIARPKYGRAARLWRAWARHVLRRRVRPRVLFADTFFAAIGAARSALDVVWEKPLDEEAHRRAEEAIATVRGLEAPDAETAGVRDEFADGLEEWLAWTRRGADMSDYATVFRATDRPYRRWWMLFRGYPDPDMWSAASPRSRVRRGEA